jgi:hypothetical protein
MPRTKGSKNRKTILKEHEKSKKPPAKLGRPKNRKRKTKTIPIKTIKEPSVRTRIPVAKPDAVQVPPVPTVIKGKAKDIKTIKRDLEPTLIHRKGKRKAEKDTSWTIRKEREPWYDPEIPLETSGGMRRRFTMNLEETVRDKFAHKTYMNSLYADWVLNELMKRYNEGKINIEPDYKEMGKWPWGILGSGGDVVPAAPETPVYIPEEWPLEKEARLKREQEERKEKRGKGTQKSFKCPHCKKGRGTLRSKVEDPTDKWYECDKCHKTWRRMRVTSTVGGVTTEEVSKDILGDVE